MKLCTNVLVVLLLVGWGAALRAQSADALVSEGVEARRKGRDADALALFQRALGIQKTPRTVAQVALAEQALGLWDRAEADLLEALADKRDPWIGRNRATLNKALAVIQSHLGTLEIWGTPPGAVITVNGKPVGALPLSKPVRVAGDTALLTARASGFLDASRSVRTPAGQSVREYIELLPAPVAAAPARQPEKVAVALPPAPLEGIKPEPKPAPPDEAPPAPPSSSSPTLRVLAWSAGALAAGGLALGIVETLLAVRNKQRFEDHTDSSGEIDCTTVDLTTACRPLQEAYQRSVTLAIVGYAAGGALAVGSFLLFRLSSTPKDRTEARVSCLPDTGTRGLSCFLRF